MCFFCQNCGHEEAKNGSVSVPGCRGSGIHFVEEKDRQRCDERQYTGEQKAVRELVREAKVIPA